MKKIFFLLLLLPAILFAQKTINHTVAAKESFSSIGRLYNVNGRELADFNKLDYTKGLSIGQVIKVPVKGVTTTAPTTAVPVKPAPAPIKSTANTSGSPMYHTVIKKETLYHVTTLFSSATLANLRKWNNLASDNIQEGQVLIVGYGTNATKVTNTTEVTKIDDGKKMTVISETKETDVVEAPREDPNNQVVVPERSVEEPVKTVTPSVPEKNNTITNTSAGAGFFKGEYKPKGETKNGLAGVFKSSSGWDNGKYYALFDGARSGAVLKVTNKANGTSVYLKVLDIIPTLPDNKNIIIRISNAASKALGADEANFDCEITW